MKHTVYPWLFAIAPIAHLYSVNLGLVSDLEAAVTALASTLLVSLLYLATRLVLKDHDRSAALASAMLLAFLFFGHLNSLIGQRRKTLLVLLLLIAPITATLLRRETSTRLRALTPALNVAALVLLLLPGARIADHWARRALQPGIQSATALPNRGPVAKTDNGPGRPDVYYIVADGYPSDDFLLREYGYDNSTFTGALEGLGFFVAYESRSNYGTTLNSLASSLSMDYVRANPSRLNDTLFLRLLIADSRVASEFVRRGYTYVFLNSGYLLMSSIADELVDVDAGGLVDPSRSRPGFDRFNYLRIDSFYRLVAETTPLTGIKVLEPLLLGFDKPLPWWDRRRLPASLEFLESVPTRPEATFLLAHVIAPHGPVRFSRDGGVVHLPPEGPSPQQFLDQIEYLNEKLLETLRAILESSSEPPVIVLQADHGTDLGEVDTRDGRFTHFEILNAIHLPGPRPPALRSDISPVNTFRVLLNELFDTDYALLPDRQFEVRNGYESPFDQVDVTPEIARGRDANPGSERAEN